MAWNGVLKPRHFLGVRLAVMTMSWISSSDIRSMESRGERHTRFAFVEDEHGPGALADDEVAFPMANVGAGFDVFRSIVDRGAVFDRIAGGSRPARSSALVTAGQIAPEVLALVGGAIDEGVDGLELQGAQTALVAGLEPSGNLFGRPSFRKTIADESPQFLIFLEYGFTPPAQLIGSGGVSGE